MTLTFTRRDANRMRRPPLSGHDLEYFLDHAEHLAPMLRNRRILLTGGTGFFGTWLVECFLHLNRRLGLRATLTVVTRDPAAFSSRSPHLAHDPAFSMAQGEIRSFPFPPGRFSHIIHAATESVATADSDLYAAIVEGTHRVLSFAGQCGAQRLLYVSSGAVYGPQPRSVLHVAEDAPFQPDDGAYTQGKRAAEQLCLQTPDMECVLARAFAFLGPHLPLRAHFAAGNFIADALDGVDIDIRGDGTPLRSYLYAVDLSVWLWTLLLRGQPAQAYNVGAEEPVSIRELAGRTVAVVDPERNVRVHGAEPPPGTPPPRYVPSTLRAREELGLQAGISLEEAIRRTAEWNRLARA